MFFSEEILLAQANLQLSYCHTNTKIRTRRIMSAKATSDGAERSGAGVVILDTSKRTANGGAERKDAKAGFCRIAFPSAMLETER